VHDTARCDTFGLVEAVSAAVRMQILQQLKMEERASPARPLLEQTQLSKPDPIFVSINPYLIHAPPTSAIEAIVLATEARR
jgi:hypothetical protein